MSGIPPDRPDPPDPADPADPPIPAGTLDPDDLEPFVPPESAADATDASRLLVEAVGQLPPADRDRVYAWLLRTGFRPQPAAVPGPLARRLGWELGRQQQVQTQTREWGAAVVAELLRSSS